MHDLTRTEAQSCTKCRPYHPAHVPHQKKKPQKVGEGVFPERARGTALHYRLCTVCIGVPPPSRGTLSA